jgi:hypothetical protein
MNNILCISIGIIIGIIITFLLLEVRNRCFIKDSATELLFKNIRILTRQASRWSTAAKQDKSPLIAVLHSNYGAGFLWALKNIATGEQIKSATGIDIKKLEREIVDIQDETTTNMSKICPKYAPESSYLSKVAKEGS